MDPVTITVIVLVSGGAATAAGVNPIYIILGIVSMMAVLFLPIAGVLTVISEVQRGTLTHETVLALIFSIGLVSCFFMPDTFLVALLYGTSSFLD